MGEECALEVGRAEGEGEGEPVGAGEGREERGELIETRRRGRMGE